jgi:lysophospholipase L1-like esterase
VAKLSQPSGKASSRTATASWRNPLLSVASLLLLLALLEAGFRLFDVRGHFADRTRGYESVFLPEEERLDGLARQFRPDSEFELRYDSDPRGYFDASGGLRYRINRHGFRGPDWSERKQPGTLRLMLLGDSFTFGEGVRWEDTFGERLEGLLSERLDRPVEVLNVATGGWDTHDEISYLGQRGRAFEPDAILIVYVLNDAGYPVGVDLWEGFRSAYEPEGWLKRSYLLSFAFTRIAREIRGRRYVESMVASSRTRSQSWDLSFALLSQGRLIAEQIGAGYGVVLFPFLYRLDADHPFRPLHELVGRACASSGIPFNDLLDAFEGRSYAELWVHPSDQHPNDEGHRIAAEAIARFVLAEDLLPRPRREIGAALAP